MVLRFASAVSPSPASHRLRWRALLPLLPILLWTVFQASCYRSSSVMTFGHGVGTSKTTLGPVVVDCKTHSVADGRGVLFECQVITTGGFDYRVGMLTLTSHTPEQWFSVDPESDVSFGAGDEPNRQLALGHADFSWGGGAMHTAPLVAVAHAPGTTAPAYDPNRVSVTVPVDTSDLSAPADAPFLAFRDEEVPAPADSLFLVILGPEGPKRPTRIGTGVDLAAAASDPEAFVGRIFDEQPLLRQILEEAR